ncbi:MAG: deoxyribodipyrimidine photo-lyase [Spirochaetaceae bacterium]
MKQLSLPGLHPARITRLNDKEARPQGSYVLYWVQRAQRSEDNHALEYAIAWANALSVPMVACFGLTTGYPEANLRHYAFLLEGLRDLRRGLEERGVGLVCAWGSPPDVALRMAENAALVVTDGAYLYHLRTWRARVARESPCRVDLVETDLVVPVRQASDHREYAARTIRKKLMAQVPELAHLPEHQGPDHPSLEMVRRILAPGAQRSKERRGLEPVASLDLDKVSSHLEVDTTVRPVSTWFVGGQTEALHRFGSFLAERFADYDDRRNHPGEDATSGMSPYLHFGHVSPIRLVIEAEEARGTVPSGNVDTFVEELVVRRELAYNYCYYTRDYASYESLPDWARSTLAGHKGDERPAVYNEATLEAAETHDDYWNAAMTEMKITGSMHNYMRMYWGKKILEWSSDPKAAFETTLRLNNKYFLDGRDANSFANVGWIFGLHDRPWPERAIYGKVRTMTASGLERKTDIGSYVLKVRRLAEEAPERLPD